MSINFNYGLYYESKNEFGIASSYYKSLIKENPYFIEAYIKLGELANKRGHKIKAIDYMRQAVEKHFKSKEEIQNKQPNTDSNKNNQNEEKKANTNLSIENQRLISVLNKPINPMLILAQLHFDNFNDVEAMNILQGIIQNYDDKDCYTLIFAGNLYYESALQIRQRQNDFSKRINRALQYYFKALEIDKYNAYAAIGIANIFSEYGLTNQSLDIYKSINEKFTLNISSFYNEALIYTSDGKYEKAALSLKKLLKRFFKNGKIPEVENLFAKVLIELKDFKNAELILQGLILKYPDNLFYKFNYALNLKAKAEEVLLRSERRVFETEDAIKSLDKAIPIFISILKLKKEGKISFTTNEKEEKMLKTSDFMYRINEVIDYSKLSLRNLQVFLETDKKREKEIISKIEENKQKLNMRIVILIFIILDKPKRIRC